MADYKTYCNGCGSPVNIEKAKRRYVREYEKIGARMTSGRALCSCGSTFEFNMGKYTGVTYVRSEETA